MVGSRHSEQFGWGVRGIWQPVYKSSALVEVSASLMKHVLDFSEDEALLFNPCLDHAEHVFDVPPPEFGWVEFLNRTRLLRLLWSGCLNRPLVLRSCKELSIAANSSFVNFQLFRNCSI